jgi:hypothetical protein
VNRIQRATTGPVRSLDGARPRRVGDDDNSRILMTRLPGWLRVPASVRDQGFTNRYVASAVAAVGLVVAAVAVRGHRTQGRSAFYQNALLGFGPARARSHRHEAADPRLRQRCGHIPHHRHPVLAVGHPGPQPSGCSKRRSVPAPIAFAAGSITGGHVVASLLTKNRP